MSIDLATLAIVVDSQQAEASVMRFGTTSVKTAGQVGILEQATGKLEGVMSRVRVLFGLGLFGFKFLTETIDAQDAMAQLEAGVKSTGQAAGFTAKQLGEQAGALEALSTFSDEAIEHGQGVLLLFERLGGVNFERATQSAVDLAERLKTDVPAAAQLLGKALEDPEQGMLGLRRAGIILSQSQKDVIKDLMNTGHEVDAQSKLLDIFEQKIGGSAAAARDTLGGSLKGLAHDFGNLFEVSKDGTSTLVAGINALGQGFRTLNEHSEIVINTLKLLAGTVIAKNLQSFATFIALQLQMIQGEVMAAEANVAHTAALTKEAVATEEAARWQVALAESYLNNAKIAIGYTIETDALAAAEARVVATTIALTDANAAATAATIRLSEAQIAEAAAATAAAGATSVATVAVTRLGAAAAVAWRLVGGWVGVAIAGLIAAYMWISKFLEKQEKANELTEEQQKAYEKALATERARNAEIERAAENAKQAADAARKANAERDAETAKMHTLNAAYRENSLTLKLMGIELDANTAKVKAHKDTKQSEWAAIDASIDAQTRELKIAAQRADQLERESRLRGAQREGTSAVRSAQQELDLSKLMEDQQARRRIQLNYENALYEARLDFAEKTRNATEAQVKTAQQEYEVATRRAATLRDIANAQNDVNEQLAREAEQLQLNQEYARQRNEAADEQLQKMKEAEQAVEDTKERALDFVDSFFGAMTGGADSFWDFFKQAAERTFAELASKKLVEKLLSVDAIAAIFSKGDNKIGGLDKSVYSQEMLDKMGQGGGGLAGMLKMGGQAAGMLAGAFKVGGLVGSQTTNPYLGALGGALGGGATGAAMGATMGGPIGAVAGGIIGAGAGLIGGFLGAKKASEQLAQELKRQEMAHAQIANSLASWRAQITGTAEDQKKANEAELRWKYLSLVQTIQQVEAGKKMEEQREKDLKEAAELYEMAQKKLTETTNDLNDAFTGMINAVSGYKLNLALFNNSPALGPHETNLNTGAGGSGSSGGSGSGGNGSGEFTDSSRPLNVNLVVDGKTLAKVTVNAFRKVAQSQLGSSDQILEAMTLI